MPLWIIHYAEDVANGVQTKSHPMNAAQWDHFRFWLAVFRRIKEAAMQSVTVSGAL